MACPRTPRLAWPQQQWACSIQTATWSQVAWPLVVTQAMDIITDTDGSRAIDPDMALSYSPIPDICMTLDNNIGH